MNYFIILFLILLMYVSVMVLVYKYQHLLIFRPIILEKDTALVFDTDFEEIWLGRRNKLNAILFSVPNPKGVVLYHHGNSRNIQHWGQFYKDFTGRGYHVLFYDYRGFGKSKGILTENSLYRDAANCHAYLSNRFPHLAIYQFGRSLGSALATHLAVKFGSPFLVLETPYLSMRAMAQRSFPILPIKWMIRFPLRQDLDIVKIDLPILILSGTADELTPHNHSLLLSKMNPKIELVILKNGMHNGLNEYTEYQKALDKYYGTKI
jgi:alpha-beta hydrolase superfamily lysophospholipase